MYDVYNFTISSDMFWYDVLRFENITKKVHFWILIDFLSGATKFVLVLWCFDDASTIKSMGKNYRFASPTSQARFMEEVIH